MGLSELPEIKLAKRIHSKHNLDIPFDLNTLVNSYSKIVYKEIPIRGIDGVSVNLSIPEKKPKIVLDSTSPHKRQRFTLAHELGHIIIPWHLGTIVDEIYPESYSDHLYKEIEGEANRFAAELLMPESWVLKQIEKNADLAELHKSVVDEADVSYHAASIRLIQFLPKNHVVIATDSETIWFVEKSKGTHAYLQSVGEQFKEDFFPYIDGTFHIEHNGTNYYWVKVSSEVNLAIDDERDWKQILKSMLEEIYPESEYKKAYMSINGIVGSANSVVKLSGNHKPEAVTAVIILRLRRDGLEKFYNHPHFEAFVQKRTEALFS